MSANITNIIKKRLILLDIDDTLIDFKESINGASKTIRWSSGSASLWQRFCLAIKMLDKVHGTETDFGLITYKTSIDGLTLAVLGKLSPKFEEAILVKGVDDKGLSDFLDNPARFYFTDGNPKEKAMTRAAIDHQIQNPEDLWIVDDREEDACKPARALGFTAFHANVICDDKDEERQKVKTLINAMLTKANNNQPITLDELVPEKTTELEEEERQKTHSEQSGSTTLQKVHGHLNPDLSEGSNRKPFPKN